ncbi:hypothetical protein SAMN06265346_10619 [Flavobacterium hercynium]|nr:hypothetical protein SAMN06265346_10619 [Flavobacterium hercynium]
MVLAAILKEKFHITNLNQVAIQNFKIKKIPNSKLEFGIYIL